MLRGQRNLYERVQYIQTKDESELIGFVPVQQQKDKKLNKYQGPPQLQVISDSGALLWYNRNAKQNALIKNQYFEIIPFQRVQEFKKEDVSKYVFAVLVQLNPTSNLFCWMVQQVLSMSRKFMHVLFLTVLIGGTKLSMQELVSCSGSFFIDKLNVYYDALLDPLLQKVDFRSFVLEQQFVDSEATTQFFAIRDFAEINQLYQHLNVRDQVIRAEFDRELILATKSQEKAEEIDTVYGSQDPFNVVFMGKMLKIYTTEKKRASIMTARGYVEAGKARISDAPSVSLSPSRSNNFIRLNQTVTPIPIVSRVDNRQMLETDIQDDGSQKRVKQFQANYKPITNDIQQKQRLTHNSACEKSPIEKADYQEKLRQPLPSNVSSPVVDTQAVNTRKGKEIMQSIPDEAKPVQYVLKQRQYQSVEMENLAKERHLHPFKFYIFCLANPRFQQYQSEMEKLTNLVFETSVSDGQMNQNQMRNRQLQLQLQHLAIQEVVQDEKYILILDVLDKILGPVYSDYFNSGLFGNLQGLIKQMSGNMEFQDNLLENAETGKYEPENQPELMTLQSIEECEQRFRDSQCFETSNMRKSGRVFVVINESKASNVTLFTSKLKFQSKKVPNTILQFSENVDIIPDDQQVYKQFQQLHPDAGGANAQQRYFLYNEDALRVGVYSKMDEVIPVAKLLVGDIEQKQDKVNLSGRFEQVRTSIFETLDQFIEELG